MVNEEGTTKEGAEGTSTTSDNEYNEGVSGRHAKGGRLKKIQE